jgi:hypothetical protein
MGIYGEQKLANWKNKSNGGIPSGQRNVDMVNQRLKNHPNLLIAARAEN